MNRMTTLIAIIVSGLLALALPVSSMAGGAYTFKDISYPGSHWTWARGINNSGQVVGYYSPDGESYHGFIYTGGIFSQLDYPEAADTEIWGISNNGQLFGWLDDSSGYIHWWVRNSNGKFAMIDLPGDPNGINNDGKVVGFYGTWPAHGFVYSGGSFITIDYPGALLTYAYGINDSGVVVGCYEISPEPNTYVVNGFTFDGSKFTTISSYPGARSTCPKGINNKGAVVGNYFDSASHPYVYSAGSFTTLDYPGSAGTTGANGINDNGDVVGYWCVDASCSTYHGFLATRSRSISGTVKNRKGIPVEEVTITLSGTSSDETKTAFDGSYTFSDVKSGHYVITPSKDKYTFKPKSIKATVKDDDLEGQDFILQTFTISGTVKNKKGEPADGISMNLGGDSTDTTQTASDGTYSFTDLMNGKYTITPLPTTEWYTFKPISKNVTVHENDVKNQNFTGKSPCQISGSIVNGTIPVQGVTVTLTGKSNDQVTTDQDGSYQFGGLQEGSYVVTPSLAGYAFKATSRKVKITDSDIEDVNFSASMLHSLSGTVTSGGNPLPDVTMSLTGKAKAATTTAVDGSYSFPNLAIGAYTVTPTMSGHKFTPSKQAVKMTGSDVGGVDFAGSP